MIVISPDFRDPEIDGPADYKFPPKGRAAYGRTWLLAGIAMLNLGWGAVSLVVFVRKEPDFFAHLFFIPRLPYRDGAKINLEHFQQIRTGMSRGEVEKLL